MAPYIGRPAESLNHLEGYARVGLAHLSLSRLGLLEGCGKINVARFVSGGIGVGDIRAQKVHALRTKARTCGEIPMLCRLLSWLLPCLCSTSYATKACQSKIRANQLVTATKEGGEV